MDVTTKSGKLTAMLEDAVEYRKDYAEKVETVEGIYNGDYNPYDYLGFKGPKGFVKTHGLYTQVRKTVAMMMPPPYIEFITEAANKAQQPDVDSADTAKHLLDYLFNVRDGRATVSEGLHDICITNFMRFRLAFKEDNRIETMEEQLQKTTEGVVDSVIDAEGDKIPGQPYFIPIRWKDFLMPRGFSRVEDAWSGGGWVARQFYPYHESVKNNPNYNSYKTKIKPDAKFKGQEVDLKNPSFKKKNDEYSAEDLKYNCLWEIFFGPTPGYPDGRYVIHSMLQNITLYDFKGKCFKGLNIPIVEEPMFRGRAGEYYVTPLAVRSINPLMETEYFESRILVKNSKSKTLIAVRDDVADETKDIMAGDNPVFTGTAKTLSADAGGPPFVVEEVILNVDNDRLGSQSAQARFEKLWGFSTMDPRLEGGQIATEMVLNNKISLTEMNDLIIRVNKCVERVASGLLIISKEKMTPAEMDRIVRSGNITWQDDSNVTLEGDYGVRVKSKQLYDMTEGERSKVLQMYFSTLAQASALPALANRIDIVPALKAWSDELNFPTAATFRDSQKVGQEWETTQMLSGNMINAQVEDDHVEHLNSLQEYFMTFEQTKQSSQGTVDALFLQNLQAHAQQHQQFLQMMQAGAQGVASQISNPVNDARSAGAETIRSDGATGTIGEQNQPEGL